MVTIEERIQQLSEDLTLNKSQLKALITIVRADIGKVRKMANTGNASVYLSLYRYADKLADSLSCAVDQLMYDGRI